MTHEPEHDLPQHVQLLKAIREQRHWSQAELATALCVHERTIQRWESGEKDPHPGWLPAIRQLLKESA